MKKTITWVLIANGTQARVLENCGPGKGLRQVEGLEWSIEPLQAHEIVSDRPGAYRSPGGGGRGGMEPKSDPVQQREDEFLRGVAAELDTKQQAGEFHRLVIAAAPVALGEIRKVISAGVQKTIVGELNKDLTNLPTAQLDKHFDGIIAA